MAALPQSQRSLPPRGRPRCSHLAGRKGLADELEMHLLRWRSRGRMGGCRACALCDGATRESLCLCRLSTADVRPAGCLLVTPAQLGSLSIMKRKHTPNCGCCQTLAPVSFETPGRLFPIFLIPVQLSELTRLPDIIRLRIKFEQSLFPQA